MIETGWRRYLVIIALLVLVGFVSGCDGLESFGEGVRPPTLP